MGDNEESTNSDKVLIVPLSEDSKRITQVLSNEKAMKMLDILADRPMSASDVAEQLELPLTTVKYNLDGLVEADLIKVKETKWSKKGRQIKIYEPVQKFIVVAPGSTKDDRSSIISMLKKYLGLVAGAVFAATGLEALTRSFSMGAAPAMSQEASTSPVPGEEPMAFMAKDVAEEDIVADELVVNEEMPEETALEIETDAESTEMTDIATDDSVDVPIEEEMPVEEAMEYEVPAEEMSADGIPGVDEVSPEMVASSAPNGSEAGAGLMRDGMANVTGNQKETLPVTQAFTDNMTAVAEPAGSIFRDGLLSHISVWFFFGCLFIITLLFVREMYYRKKNI
ncbi:helix-turn-helix domain-containing protein [Methanolobus sp. WCC4]|uniref:ArsR/SmtB family transcription factor n=1 Tax=Methanolobus sp. WCC4 TaxID=3125784 RepID=UPI0030F85E4F